MTDEVTSKPGRKGGLGKGLNSLLGVDSSGAAGKSPRLSADSIVSVDVAKVKPNPDQPRKHFSEEQLQQLANSVLVDGIIQPLIVVKEGAEYLIVAGERRWRAAKLAGLKKVPVLVKDLTQGEFLRLAIIENVQRSDLNVIEEAEAYATLIKELGLTQEECARQVGKDRSTISNAIRILGLPRRAKDELVQGTIAMGHGRALVGLDQPDKILDVLAVVIKKSLSVRQTELLVKKMKSGIETATDKDSDANLQYLAESLRGHLKTKVKLVGSGAKGKIEISYFSPSELERLLELISKDQF